MRDLNDYARDCGVVVTVLSPGALPNVAAQTPVAVTFILAARPYARPGVYAADLHLLGTPAGDRHARRLRYDLAIRIDVDRAPTPVIAWAGGPFNSFPAVARGATATETASFTTSVDLTDVRFVRTRMRRPRGVTITLARPSSASIAANAPTTVSLAVVATGLPSRAPGGFFAGAILVIGRPVGATRPVALYPALHITGAVN